MQLLCSIFLIALSRRFVQTSNVLWYRLHIFLFVLIFFSYLSCADGLTIRPNMVNRLFLPEKPITVNREELVIRVTE